VVVLLLLFASVSSDGAGYAVGTAIAVGVVGGGVFNGYVSVIAVAVGFVVVDDGNVGGVCFFLTLLVLLVLFQMSWFVL